jgi:hypothetical protein
MLTDLEILCVDSRGAESRDVTSAVDSRGAESRDVTSAVDSICSVMRKVLYKVSKMSHIKVWRTYGLAVILAANSDHAVLFLPLLDLGLSPSALFWVILKCRLIFD